MSCFTVYLGPLDADQTADVRRIEDQRAAAEPLTAVGQLMYALAAAAEKLYGGWAPGWVRTYQTDGHTVGVVEIDDSHGSILTDIVGAAMMDRIAAAGVQVIVSEDGYQGSAKPGQRITFLPGMNRPLLRRYDFTGQRYMLDAESLRQLLPDLNDPNADYGDPIVDPNWATTWLELDHTSFAQPADPETVASLKILADMQVLG